MFILYHSKQLPKTLFHKFKHDAYVMSNKTIGIQKTIQWRVYNDDITVLILQQ